METKEKEKERESFNHSPRTVAPGYITIAGRNSPS
jgi:hypothetical protein